jgi:hypothetical protein
MVNLRGLCHNRFLSCNHWSLYEKKFPEAKSKEKALTE